MTLRPTRLRSCYLCTIKKELLLRMMCVIPRNYSVGAYLQKPVTTFWLIPCLMKLVFTTSTRCRYISTLCYKLYNCLSTTACFPYGYVNSIFYVLSTANFLQIFLNIAQNFPNLNSVRQLKIVINENIHVFHIGTYLVKVNCEERQVLIAKGQTFLIKVLGIST